MSETRIKIDLTGVGAKLKKLEPNGKCQMALTMAIMNESENYIPLKNGILRDTARMGDDGTYITYNTPYARYLWYGKLYVDPKTLKGAFHDSLTGRFWSRPKTKKIPSERSLNFNGAPIRGPRWVERAWESHKDEIINQTIAIFNEE